MAKKSTLRNKCDRLWRTNGKETAECEVCKTIGVKFKFNKPNPHHYIGRVNKRLRWDLRNRVWLCPSHHILGFPSAHQDIKWFEEWMKTYRKEDWLYCNKVKNEKMYQIDYEKILKELYKKQKGGL